MSVIRIFICALVAFFLAAGFAPATAHACGRTQTQGRNCGTRVPTLQYQGGGVKVKTFRATACFDVHNNFGEKYILDSISPRGRKGHPFPYTVDFVYNPNKGSYEIIKTVSNGSACWTHNVAAGVWMAVYVTCKTYTGWVAAKVTGPGGYTMVKVPWAFVEKLP